MCALRRHILGVLSIFTKEEGCKPHLIGRDGSRPLKRQSGRLEGEVLTLYKLKDGKRSTRNMRQSKHCLKWGVDVMRCVVRLDKTFRLDRNFIKCRVPIIAGLGGDLIPGPMVCQVNRQKEILYWGSGL